MRKMYESEQDLMNEQSVIEKLSHLWSCEFIKLPIRYGVDFASVRNDYVVGFCEIKCRNYSMSQIDSMGGYMISSGKWSSAKLLSESTGIPFVLVVKANEAIWSYKIDDFTPSKVLLKGRKDRDDWQDMEPCIILDCNNFRRIDQ